MKATTIWMVIAITAIGFCGNTFAEERGGGGQRGRMMKQKMQHRRHMMAEKLGITEEQKAKIKELRQGLREEDDKEAARAEFREGMGKILTDDQKAKIKEFRGKQRAQHRRHMIAERLGLTDAQKGQVKELRENIRGMEGDKDAKHAAFRDGMKNILTAEQKAKLEQWRQKRQERAGAPKAEEAPAPKPRQNFEPKR